ncbi:MAG: 2'-5' RNA ligase family protein [Clostridia bacterium]|nr:2'-5' RNA ligase family protein [Clostridia bacterium]
MAFNTMEDKKFLTVMAVLDNRTQRAMGDIQSALIAKVGDGTQTMGIPFHITLGSYSTDELDSVMERVREAANVTKPFDIRILGQDSFGDKVLFLKPEKSEELLRLRAYFENDYALGYEWTPHATLICGEAEQVRSARELVCTLDLPPKATVVGIELGEFFPPKKVIRIDFTN